VACTAYKIYESTQIIENPNKYDDWIPRDTTYNNGGFISEPVDRYIRNPWDILTCMEMFGNGHCLPTSHILIRMNMAAMQFQLIRNALPAMVCGTIDRKRSTSSFRLPYRDYQKVYNVGFHVVMLEE